VERTAYRRRSPVRWADNRCGDDDDYEGRILYHRDLGDVVIEPGPPRGNNESLARAKGPQWGQAAAGPGGRYAPTRTRPNPAPQDGRSVDAGRPFGISGYPAVLVAHDLKLYPLPAERPRTLPEVCDVLNIAPRGRGAGVG
jgi:hypothetical protein